jgi:hypothetical protein
MKDRLADSLMECDEQISPQDEWRIDRRQKHVVIAVELT